MQGSKRSNANYSIVFLSFEYKYINIFLIEVSIKEFDNEHIFIRLALKSAHNKLGFRFQAFIYIIFLMKVLHLTFHYE